MSQEEKIALYSQQQEMELARVMYEFELRRAKYLLQMYHRTRLHKIEQFFMWVLDMPEVHGRLSTKVSL